jgi:hypothetical protein
MDETPVSYLINRLSERWDLDQDQRDVIYRELYAKGVDNGLLALQASELENSQLHLLFPYLPREVVLQLDDILI